PGRAVAVRADLLDRDDIPRLVDEARNALGPITVLVNNAAFTAPGRPPKPGEQARPKSKAAGTAKPDWPPLLGTPLSAYRRHFEISVFAAYELIQLVCPDMIRAGLVRSSTSPQSPPGCPVTGPTPTASAACWPGYGGSKAALEHLTWCAAFDLQGHNVAVNALAPSKPIMTPGLSYYAADFKDVATADEFARAAVELALVDADTVTGRTIGHHQVLDGSFSTFSPPQPDA
ncbi:SDR family oxidoreductase, partial [Mycolicibacterium vaccae]|nr:SDR family oxidoreductase [Mycolicibacterium vaccae]